MKDLLENITVLSDSDPFFQRESGQAHTSYLIETAFYSLISQGETEKALQMFDSLLNSGITVGKLSANPLRQFQYWAVCCITLGARYAMQGGLDEMTAYNLSDKYIIKIDSLSNYEDIIEALKNIVIELSTLVKKNAHINCPSAIKKCLKYISEHFHEKIKTEDLAKITSYSADYISKLFTKVIGCSIHEYVLSKKIEEAKAMLLGGYDQSIIAYSLGFCSQTHLISCFKKHYGITPKQMLLAR